MGSVVLFAFNAHVWRVYAAQWSTRPLDARLRTRRRAEV
jgi:hypothetical protein